MSDMIISQSSDDYALFCKNNLTMLKFQGEEYCVQAINYNNYTIRVMPVNADHNCSHIPSYPNFFEHYLTFDIEIRFGHVGVKGQKLITTAKAQVMMMMRVHKLTETIMFLCCEKLVLNNPSYKDTIACFNITPFFLFLQISVVLPLCGLW